MLHIVSGDDGRVVTVYSQDANIGGLTLNRNNLWHWAVYCLRNGDPEAEVELGPLAGTERTQQAALAALKARWERWLSAAGLTYRT